MAPTVRDEDGLALSSRNKKLTESQRVEALKIYQSLKTAKELTEKGTTNTDRLIAEVTNRMNSLRLRVIYVKAVSLDDMSDIREVVSGQTLIAVAVWVDQIRLIDNMVV